MELNHLHRFIIRETQVAAIVNNGYLPDESRYGYATATMFQELEQEIEGASEAMRVNLEATRQLILQIGQFQNPRHLYALVRYNREVLTAARSLGLANDSWVPFASASIGLHNATTRLLGDAYVTVYNDGLFTLSSALGSLFSSAIDSLLNEWDERESMEEAAIRILGPDSPVNRAIVGTIATYAVMGDVRNYFTKVPPSLRTSRHSDFYVDGILRFVVAHELGHVYLRHMESQPIVHSRPATASFRWQQEYDADLYATRVLSEMMLNPALPDGGSVATLAIALQLTLVIAIFTYAAQEYLNEGEVHSPDEGSGNHPPPDDRYRYVLGHIDQMTDLYPNMDPDGIEVGHEIIRVLINQVLPALRSECLRLRAEGVRGIQDGRDTVP